MTFLVAVALTLAPTAPAPDLASEAGKAMDQIAVYVHDQERANIEATMHELQLEFGAWLKQITPPPPPTPAPRSPSPTPALGNSGAGGGGVPSSSSGGSCYDGPIPSYIVTRESGGNPGAVNASSGAYGCFQIMPYVWAANCGDLGRDVAGQIACAGRISNGGTNLAPWR